MRVNSIPLTKDQARQVRAFIKQERMLMADKIKWKQKPLTADEMPISWAWKKWPIERATDLQELNNWFTKGENQMLQVKGTDEYRVPTENDVVWQDQIIGCDPDPNVRAELLRDAQANEGGGSMLRKAQAGDGNSG